MPDQAFAEHSVIPLQQSPEEAVEHVLVLPAQKLHSSCLPLNSAVHSGLLTGSVCAAGQRECSLQLLRVPALTLYGSDECSSPLFQSLTRKIMHAVCRESAAANSLRSIWPHGAAGRHQDAGP